MSPNPSQSQLVILDTGVVIQAHKTGTWAAVVAKFEVVLSSIVVAESLYYDHPKKGRVQIDLTAFIQSKQISVVSVPASEGSAFSAGFGDPTYVERIDAGELESMVYLLHHAPSGSQICSGDGIVFRVLGRLKKAELGVSFEELLKSIGLERALPETFTRKAREKFTTQGFLDAG